MKCLVVYNTCGISGNENFVYYQNALESFINQDYPKEDYKIVVSACQMSKFVKEVIVTGFRNRLSYNFIDESLPLSITFNFTVQKMFEAFGEFDQILYVDSGINLFRYPTALSELMSSMKPEYAMLAARPNNDTGYEWWKIVPDRGHYVLRPGQACNLHLQLFSSDIYKLYGNKLLPDIFANDTSESVFTFLSAGIRRKFAINPEVLVFHNHSMDGASIGWQGPLLFKSQRSIFEICNEGAPFGFGYEEYNSKYALIHDPLKFDENGYALNPKLYPWMKENIYLGESQFSYSTIKHQFLKGL